MFLIQDSEIQSSKLKVLEAHQDRATKEEVLEAHQDRATTQNYI